MRRQKITHSAQPSTARRVTRLGGDAAGRPQRDVPDGFAGVPSDSLTAVTEQHQQHEHHAHRFERGTDGPRVIMVGLDGSESSLRAAAYAGGLARRQGALLAVVYVQPVVAAGAMLGAPVTDTTDEIAEDLIAQIREAAERVRGIFDVRWEFHTYRGDPYNGLVQAADELTADAVVVGASEKAGHRIVGSVAVRLVKAGRWPVTVVP
ncbi:nucleotide-binding universal stress UspA family protein [Streptomyces sp. V3I7]|nr:nucleotide-binding universal stress UspA family protein [Streptomyces sp. V3I7]